MRLLCWFGRHDTRIVTEGDEGRITCRRCDLVLDRWPLLRPEQQQQDQRTHAAILADRERRAAQMGSTKAKLLRMSR